MYDARWNDILFHYIQRHVKLINNWFKYKFIVIFKSLAQTIS